MKRSIEKPEIAFVVTKARKEQNLSLEELGNITNLDRKIIADIENGTRSISSEWIANLAHALDLDPNELIFSEGTSSLLSSRGCNSDAMDEVMNIIERVSGSLQIASALSSRP